MSRWTSNNVLVPYLGERDARPQKPLLHREELIITGDRKSEVGYSGKATDQAD